MKKAVFTTAWQFIKDGICATISDALKLAWNKFKLITQLKSGVSYFRFRKSDGTQREAIGTLNNTNFQYESKGSDRKPNPALITYWDLEKRAFRSLNMATFLGFN
jgi:hypothetical protein